MKVEIYFTGRVQGVNFRYYAFKRARELGLCGFIRNLADGRVHAVAQGPADAVKSFLEWARQGSPLARVEDVEVRELPENHGADLPDFEIRY